MECRQLKKRNFELEKGGGEKMTKAGNRIKGIHLQPDSPTTLYSCSGGRGAYMRVAGGSTAGDKALNQPVLAHPEGRQRSAWSPKVSQVGAEVS